MAGKIYPIGIQNFEKIRKDGYFYIDKTALVYQMVKTGSYFFLSRPRRFGKSLLVSTLDAYFRGKKELFAGLAMEQLEKEWIEYPIFHFDFLCEVYNSPEALTDRLNVYLTRWEERYGAESYEVTLSQRFMGVIHRAHQNTGRRAVILVDEYDKPMLEALGNDKLLNEYRDTLMNFFGVMKSCDGDIEFALLTGVTKLGESSAFSGLNNLMDISMGSQYAELCGFTEKELHDNLEDELHEFAAAQKMTYDEVCAKLKEEYDGYHFGADTVSIYNPFSILNAFSFSVFNSFWFKTGTPTFLVELLKLHDYPLSCLMNVRVGGNALSCFGSASSHPIPVMYQSGYLTIKDFDKEFGTYTLGFPNREVEEGFMRFLLPFYASVPRSYVPSHIRKFVQEVESGKVDDFFRRLKSFFADIPYELIEQRERHYQNVLYILSKLLGFYTKAEYHTSEGRIDMVLQTSDYVYVMEFKLDGTAEEALQQIEDKHYAAPFESDSRKLFKIGINFSPTTRNIERWVVE